MHGARAAWRVLLALCAAVAVLGVAAASADAESPIEGVWSFNGGEVAIRPAADGTFDGTVLETTSFAECPHEVGERMWTGIGPQADGSFWGLHQWFYAGSGCEPNPTLGPSAWRVMRAGTGHFLRVCLSEPGTESQPTIAADGKTAAATFGCVDSALIAPLPENTLSEFLETDNETGNGTDKGGDAHGTAAASASACIPADKLRIRIRNPKTNPLAQVQVVVRGGGVRRVFRAKLRPKSFIAVIDLSALTAPTVRATVKLTTVLGAHLKHSHTYHRC